MLGHMAPTGLAGIHLNFVMYQPTPEEMANADADEQAMMASAQNYQHRLSGYAQVGRRLRPFRLTGGAGRMDLLAL
jgi:hypothetical protein